MNIVVFDTSGPCLTIAASKDENWHVETNCVGVLRHSERLISLIDDLLKSLHIKPKDVDGWAAGWGPGSFTGLRLGWVTMKALHLSLGARCIGFSSLDLIAKNFPLSNGRFGVIVDAKRGRVYARFYEARGGTIRPRSKEKVLTADKLVREIKSPLSLFGDGLIPYRDFISKSSKQKIQFLESSTWMPRAHRMLDYARSETGKRNFLKPSELVPRYYRLSGAEEVWKDKKKKK